LTRLPGTDGVRVLAHSLFVDGSQGGSISSDGKRGIQVSAGSSPSPCDSAATLRFDSTSLIATAGNADVKISACGDILLTSSTLASASSNLWITSSNGRICAGDDNLSANSLSLGSNGDLTLHGSVLTTAGARESMSLTSAAGSVIAGASQGCLPNRFQGGNDSYLTVAAEGIVDLSGDCVEIAEDIDITANGAGFDCLNSTIINLRDAEIRNDFGRPGSITATACAGVGRIDISNAILVDNGRSGGGSDPNKVANLNGSMLTQNLNCAANTTPTCTARPIDAQRNPVSADPADRILHNVAGIPRCDS